MEKPLTKREDEVLNLISSGLTYKEAAGKMMITVRMVNFHLGHVRKKLKATNNAQAVRNYLMNQGRKDDRNEAPAQHS